MSNVVTSFSYQHQQSHSFTNNNNNSTSSVNNTNITMTDDLPKQFVSSLRILFDILDENHNGFVRLSDIESRWKEDGVKGLPSGVVDALKRVTPANGYLNFDRFVAGLKLVLWRSKHTMVTSGNVSGPLSSQHDESQQGKEENKHIYHIDDDDDDIKPVHMSQLSTQHQFNVSDQTPNNNLHGQFTTNNSKQQQQQQQQIPSISADVFSTSCTIPTSSTTLPYGPTNRPNYPQSNFGYPNINYSTSSSTSTTLVTGSGHFRSNIHNSSCSPNNIVNNNTHDVSRFFNDTVHSSSGSAAPGDKMTPQIQPRLPYVTRCPERPPLQPRQSAHPHSHHYNMHLSDMPDSSAEPVSTLQRSFSPPQVPPRDQNKANILNELKNWQRQRMKNLPTDTLNARRAPEWGGINRNPTATDSTKDVDRNTYGK